MTSDCRLAAIFLMFPLLVFASSAWSQSSTPVNLNRLALGQAVFDVQWQADFNEQEKDKLFRWLQKSVNTAGQLYGNFPLEESRIRMERARRGRGPVPWGQTLRRDPEGVRFTVNPGRSLDAFVGDWTAPHELSHLFLPYPGQPDIWLSEGFASYYQNILMAREGIYSPEQAWNKLYAGFMRAARDRNTDRTLLEVSKNRRAYRATMRIYWSGALYFLEADILLRQGSGGEKNLDGVIQSFNNCCRNRYRNWSGSKLVATLDDVAGTRLFTDLYQRYQDSKRIPDMAPVLEALGISVSEGELLFSDESEVLRFRESLTAPRIAPLSFAN